MTRMRRFALISVLVLIGACILDRQGRGDGSAVAAGGGGAGPAGGGGQGNPTAGGVSLGGAGGTGGDAAGGGQGGGALFQVPCNTGLCNAGEVCCIEIASNLKVLCRPVGACQNGQFEATCDGPEDCPPGSICCGHFNSTSWDRIRCETSCEAGMDEYRMCSGNEDNCPDQESCRESQVLDDYTYCF